MYFDVFKLFLCVICVNGSPLIDKDASHKRNDRVKRDDITFNEIPGSTQSCILPGGKTGQCKHFQECPQDGLNKDNMMFMDHLCVLDQSIGICCPDDYDVPLAIKLAGQLPRIASKDEGTFIETRTMSDNRGCGVSTHPHKKISGGVEAQPSEWPWMAFVAPEGFVQHCGGVLITDRHVLTAAHCVRRYDASELEVRLGEYDYDRTNDSRSYTFRVVEKVEHHEFDHNTYWNDIAILKIHRPAFFNTFVWPICLPPTDMDLVNETAVIIGWGSMFFGGPSSPVLMEVSVPIWDRKDCTNAMTDTIFDENICAGGYDGMKDSCQGDSGGPLMYQLPSGRWTVIGIVSWGYRCGEPKHPGVYTRVDKYLQWIIDNVIV